MRIGIDGRILQDPQYSGVSVYTQSLLQALLSLPEAEPHEFVCFLNGYALNADAIIKKFPQKNIRWLIKRWPNKLVTGGEIIFSYPNLRQLFGKVDMVFVPSMQFFPIKDHTVPWILTVHDLSFEKHPEYFSPKGRLWHKLLRPRQFCQSATRLLAVSEHTKDDLQEIYHLPHNKIEVIYPGLGAPTEISATTHQQSLNLPQNYIFFLSTIEPRKNLETLLSAFALVRQQHPDLYLVLAGAPGWQFKKIARALTADKNIIYLSYLAENVKWQILKQARVFVYPSLYEGFGFPPLEAQAMGSPVIVGSHSALPEVLGNSALYANVLDVESLSRAISHLLENECLRQDFIAQGRKNVERFNWQNTARQTLNAFLNLKQ